MQIPAELGPLEIADLLEARADDDELAAEAYELFGRSIFPFEGVFCDLEVTSRGPLSESLRADVLPVDELRRWVPAFCLAVRDMESPLGDAVAAGLERLLPGPGPGDESNDSLAGVAPNLRDLSTSIRDLVDWLCTPARSGLFISSAVLERIARDIAVPRGFGSRRRVMTQLLEGASRYGETNLALSALQEVVECHRGRLGSAPWRTGALRSATEPWSERLAETSLLLSEVARELQLVPESRPAT